MRGNHWIDANDRAFEGDLGGCGIVLEVTIDQGTDNRSARAPDRNDDQAIGVHAVPTFGAGPAGYRIAEPTCCKSDRKANPDTVRQTIGSRLLR